jgi:hypothetical protein
VLYGEVLETKIGVQYPSRKVLPLLHVVDANSVGWAEPPGFVVGAGKAPFWEVVQEASEQHDSTVKLA